MHPAYEQIYHMRPAIEEVIDTSPVPVAASMDILSALVEPLNSIIGAMTTGERVQALLGVIGLIYFLGKN